MRKRKMIALLLALLMLLGSVGTAAAATPAGVNEAESLFRGQLSLQGQAIYDAILAAFERHKLDGGTASIDLVETRATSTAAVQDYLDGNRTLFDDFAAAKDAFDLAHPEAWFIDSSDLSFRVTTGHADGPHASIGIGREDNYYVDGVTGKADVAEKTAALERVVGDIVTGARARGTSYEKIRYAHDRITHAISYRFETDCTENNAGFIRTSYALVTHEGVCEAYVRSFQMVMNALGIPCVPIHGLQTSGTPEQHMWCAVRLEGEWYAVDPTWDDPVGLDKDGKIKTTATPGVDGGETETYLLVGQDVIGENWRPSGVVSTGGFEFRYPEISMLSYGSGVLERNGLKVEYARDKMEGLPSTVYHVSYNGDGLVEAAKKGYYFLVKMYDVNADGSVDAFDDWYYSVHGLHAVQSRFDPNNTFREDANPYFGDTDNYLIYNVINCEYVEFAITTKAPPAWNSSQELWDIGGYYSGDYSDILAETGLIYNEAGGYEQPPYVKNVSPGFNTPVTAGKTYNIHIEFTDALYRPDQNSVNNAPAGKANDAEAAMAEAVDLDYRGTTYAWGMNGGQPHIFADPTPAPQNIRWTCETHPGGHSGASGLDASCRLTALDYTFTSSKMWADDSIRHEFFLTGLVGVKSNKYPNSWSYVFHNNYPFTTCPLCSPFKWNLWGQPQALNNPGELDLAQLTVMGVNGKTETLAELSERIHMDPYNMNGRLMLVVENLNDSRSSTEELADAVARSTEVDIPESAVKGSSLFEIDFARVCAKTIVESGQSVRVCLGFPAGIDASMAGIVFKAYHFTRDDDTGAIVSVEEIPCTVTPYGLVVECMKFSPFEIVALDAELVPDLPVDTGRQLILTVDGRGSVTSGFAGEGSVLSLRPGESRTFTIRAEDGYAIDTVSFSNKSKPVTAGPGSAGTVTISYDDIPESGAILNVAFAAETVKQAEAAGGLTVAAPAPCVHANKTGTGYKAPTCTIPGHDGGLVCADCHAVLSASGTIPATGHVSLATGEGYVPASCGKDGKTGIVICSVCKIQLSAGEKIPMPAAEHKYRDGVCIYCGEAEPGSTPTPTPTPTPSPSPAPGGGGNSGASSTGSGVSRPATSGSATTVGVSVTAAASGATASAMVDNSSLNRAVNSAVAEASRQGAAPVVEITVSVPASADSLNVSLPTVSLRTLARAANSSLVISSGVAGVTLDHAALSTLTSSVSGSLVTLKVAPVADAALSAAQKDAMGGASVVDVSLFSGNTAVHDFGSGMITVSLPYTPRSGERESDIVVYAMDDYGRLTPCATSCANGRVTFSTTHLSKYVIGTRAGGEGEAAPGGSAFVDVDAGAYYAGAVAWAVEAGVTRGTDSAHFSPMDGCTRAQFVTFLWRAAGSPAPASYANIFSDVSAAGYADYYDAILWAAGRGVALGTGDGTTFSPDAPVLRAQAVTFMHRYARQTGLAPATGTASFADVSNTGALAPYYDAIGWAAANGVTNGSGAGAFGPMETCNRGMMITFLHRLFTGAGV